MAGLFILYLNRNIPQLRWILHTIGIDLGKTVFHLVALNLCGEVVVPKKFSRQQLLHFTANQQVKVIGKESRGGSHFLGRALREQGHEVRLMPAQYVKPYLARLRCRLEESGNRNHNRSLVETPEDYHDWSHGLTLSDFCWAIAVINKHLWEFLERQGFNRGRY